MRPLKAKVLKYEASCLYTVFMWCRGGSIETGNKRTPALAKRAFVAMCNRLGITKDKYIIED